MHFVYRLKYRYGKDSLTRSRLTEYAIAQVLHAKKANFAINCVAREIAEAYVSGSKRIVVTFVDCAAALIYHAMNRNAMQQKKPNENSFC